MTRFELRICQRKILTRIDHKCQKVHSLSMRRPLNRGLVRYSEVKATSSRSYHGLRTATQHCIIRVICIIASQIL